MADIITFNHKNQAAAVDPSTSYFVDVTLLPDNMFFTIDKIKTDAKSLLKIAGDLEKIASIIRSDVVTGKV